MHSRFLLDTHILIRWLTDKRRLTREQIRVIEHAVRRGESVALSVMSLLEMAILSGQGRIRPGAPLEQFFLELESNPAFQILPLTVRVASEVALLGSLRDPVDRVIVATARTERLQLVTSDQRIIESKLVPVVV